MQKYQILARKRRVNRSEYQVNLTCKTNIIWQYPNAKMHENYLSFCE
jgi:hypothetical protein